MGIANSVRERKEPSALLERQLHGAISPNSRCSVTFPFPHGDVKTLCYT
jgi:hypothetical protein